MTFIFKPAKEKKEDFSSLLKVNLSSYLLLARDPISKQIFLLKSMQKSPFQLKEEKIRRYFENISIEKRYFTKMREEILLFNDPKFSSNLIILKFLDEFYLCITFKNGHMVSSYMNRQFLPILEYLILNLPDLKKEIGEKKSRLDLHSGLKNKAELLSNRFNHSFLALIDLNSFKQLNDSEGHIKGDKAIEYIGVLMKKFFSDSETFRYGGDEFVILFSCTVEEAERRLSLMNILIKEKFEYISISSGVTNFNTIHMDKRSRENAAFENGKWSRSVQSIDNTTLNNALIWADKALYSAKKKKKLCIYIQNLC